MGGMLIFERLDHFLCNLEWASLFPMAEVINFDFYGSDHMPILIKLTPVAVTNVQRFTKSSYQVQFV